MKKQELRNIIKEEIRNVLVEMSIRQIKDRIEYILNLDLVKKYQKDNYIFENIPIQIFINNGISSHQLKFYQNTDDIITYDLGITYNPANKTVSVFRQK